MTYSASDTLIGPVIEQLAEIIEQQISPAPAKVYRQEPDGATLHNSVTIPLAQYKQVNATNGKLEMHLVFSVTHWFRREKYGDAVAKCYAYLPAYLQAFNAWHNQHLAGLAEISQVVNGGVKSMPYSGNVYVGLTVNVEVITDLNLDTSS